MACVDITWNDIGKFDETADSIPLKNRVVTFQATTDVKVFDIRSDTDYSNTNENLAVSILRSLSHRDTLFDPTKSIPKESQRGLLSMSVTPFWVRSIPTMVLYDELGLEIFDRITYVDEYYLTNAEIDIFKKYAQEMVEKYVFDGSVIIELGVGAMRKTIFILQEIVRQNKSVTYYANDLSESSLRECLLYAANLFPSVKFVGLHGTYLDSLAWIQKNVPEKPGVPKSFLWLGSSIGNMTRPEAAAFLARVCEQAMNVGDLFFCGIDRRNDPDTIRLAYDDSFGITRDFIMNGLTHCNRILGADVFHCDSFQYVSIFNIREGRHEAYYRSLKDQILDFGTAMEPIALACDELISVEFSYKYSADEISSLVHDARMTHVARYTDCSGRYDMHVFQKPPFFFSQLKEMEDVKQQSPSISEFEELWKAWDVVTMTMISNYGERPISVRHPYIFYLGHIPCFLDIQVSRALGQDVINSYFADIFERGIDPDLENGSCHPHSTVPSKWPLLHQIVQYREDVRAKVKSLLLSSKFSENEALSEALWMSFEHEAMHLETILYMILQSDSFSSPIGLHASVGLLDSYHGPIPAAAFRFFCSQSVTKGLSKELNSYGWDNEKPARVADVCAFSIQERPVTVGEYLSFLSESLGIADIIASESGEWSGPLIPASWVWQTYMHSMCARSVFGPLPLSLVLNTPVIVSHVQALAYASSRGLRLPSEDELLVLNESTHASAAPMNFGFFSWFPAELSPAKPTKVGEHGAWEWTSTVFADHDGFLVSELYPGYSTDFFDTKHNILMGGSWATHPRIAQRKSFRNFYQRGYPYVFATFRCVGV